MKRVKITVILLLVFFILGGCADKTGGNKDETAGQNSFTIVTSFYPIYVSTINIAKDIASVKVINMTKPQTGCLHDYQLTPQDLITLEQADTFVVNGAGMETFLSDVLAQQKNLAIVEASTGIELLTDKSGEVNPHVWVSITNAVTQVNNIAEQLSIIDPVNAEKYRSNADSYITKLEALKTKMHNSLDNIKSRDMITFHEAFPYFAQEFNLHIVAVIEREPGTTPTQKELAGIIDIVNNANVKVIFAEPQYSASAARAIANETGAKIYSLDPGVTGESDGSAYDSYINMMESNLKSLEDALS